MQSFKAFLLRALLVGSIFVLGGIALMLALLTLLSNPATTPLEVLGWILACAVLSWWAIRRK